MLQQAESVERAAGEVSLTVEGGTEFWSHFDHRSSNGARVEQIISFDRELEYANAWVTGPGPSFDEEIMFHVLSVECGGKKVRVLFEVLQKAAWLQHHKHEFAGKPTDYRVMICGKFKL